MLGMKFGPGFFGALLTGAGNWELMLSERTLNYSAAGGTPTCIDLESIHDVTETPGVIWNEVIIQSGTEEIRLDGLIKGNSSQLLEAIRSQVSGTHLGRIAENQDFVTFAANSFEHLLKRPRYLANYDLTNWAEEIQQRHGNPAKSVFQTLKSPLFPWDRTPEALRQHFETLQLAFGNNSAAVQNRNTTFVDSELREFEQFFRQVEKTPLTDEQCKAAVVMEDRNLLIAAAGSGKTSSVVGKIGYALKRDLVSPEEILVLAFNNHAARELETRINDRLGDILRGKTIKVKTFHALGLEIIADVENVKPSVPDFVSDSSGSGRAFIGDLITELQTKDPDFGREWVFFNAYYFQSATDPATFTDAQEWEKYVKETGDYSNGKNGYRTLNGELVKSQGEQAIANWLFMQGIPYEYERAYEYNTADQQYRQYFPDFYFPEIDTYLEHYALDQYGNPPAAFGDKYRQSMEWKRALHAEKETDVIETYFSDFQSGELFSKLESELTRRGAQTKPRSLKDINTHIKGWLDRVWAELPGLILTFIKHAKSNQVTAETLASRASNHRQRARAKSFVNIVCKLIAEYEKKLAAAGALDFEDMIIKAAQYADSGKFRHPWRLILVDEFQDISRARANLLAGLLKHSPGCKLFAVGDDWQSIYRFAGSDIGIFTNFSENFGKTATNFLTQTFRSNQGIANVASEFIQKNSAQVRKLVFAIDNTMKETVAIIRVEKRDHVPAQIRSCLEDIAAAARESKTRQSVYLLGRYNHQYPAPLKEWQEEFREWLKLDFKTVHSSKGLQADYVILLGLQGGKLGFPSLIADDPLLELVMPQPEAFPHAEERRLFYVALTRARHRVYLLVSKYLPSCFAEELEETYGVDGTLAYPDARLNRESGQPSERCPECKKGWLRQLDGKFGPFFGCSEYPMCRFTRKVTAVGATRGRKEPGHRKLH
jgi:DNA helicase-4